MMSSKKDVVISQSRLGHDGIALRTWLRLLTTSRAMNMYLKARLKAEFGISLARFDVMAQLARGTEPLMMSDISTRLMVTGGNVTSLIDGMERDGWVTRLPSATDRRVTGIVLTAEGKSLFEQAADANTSWIDNLLSDVSSEQLLELHELMGTLRASARLAGVR